jgi:hypothetical protein
MGEGVIKKDGKFVSCSLLGVFFSICLTSAGNKSGRVLRARSPDLSDAF